jgi:hypothetical protein
MKDSASAQNTIVAFYREYSKHRYLYFIIGKQWNKDLLSKGKGVTINIPTQLEQGRNVMIEIKHNDTQGIGH